MTSREKRHQQLQVLTGKGASVRKYKRDQAEGREGKQCWVCVRVQSRSLSKGILMHISNTVMAASISRYSSRTVRGFAEIEYFMSGTPSPESACANDNCPCHIFRDYPLTHTHTHTREPPCELASDIYFAYCVRSLIKRTNSKVNPIDRSVHLYTTRRLVVID